MVSFYSWVVCVSATFLVAMTKHLARSKLREDGLGSKFEGIQTIVLWRHVPGVWGSCWYYLPKNGKESRQEVELVSSPTPNDSLPSAKPRLLMTPQPFKTACQLGTKHLDTWTCGDILCWNYDKMVLTMSCNSSKYQKPWTKQVLWVFFFFLFFENSCLKNKWK